jgi:activator of 2-hydroxyglutaryl-CoA dehydratase
LHPAEIEVDIYHKLVQGSDTRVYIGVDIGSTSTKAILIDEARKPVAGFYTYTAGKPLSAVKSVFEAIEDFIRHKCPEITIAGVGTTGSGRKFIGKIINADLIIDEITSHARAAFELNPRTDTIIRDRRPGCQIHPYEQWQCYILTDEQCLRRRNRELPL